MYSGRNRKERWLSRFDNYLFKNLAVQKIQKNVNRNESTNFSKNKVWCPKDKSIGKKRKKIKTKEGLGIQEWKKKTDLYHPSLPHIVIILISGSPEQYNLSPLLCHREKVLALLSPTPSTCASSNQQMTHKTPNPLLVPWL